MEMHFSRLQDRSKSLALWLALLPSAWPVAAQTVPPSTVDPDNQSGPVLSERPKQEPSPFVWKSLDLGLPKGLTLFEGTATNFDGQPMKAWYARLDAKQKALAVKSVQSTSEFKRDLTSTLAQKSGAVLAVNSAYFWIKELPSRSGSIVMSGGKIIGHPRTATVRNGKTVPLLYGAFGVKKNGKYEFAWVTELDGRPYAYPSPLPNSEELIPPPASKTFPAGGRVWDVQEASGGGPILVRNGVLCLTDTEERFGPSHASRRHPRTAVGATANGDLILFVVDGRQPDYSMGMSLAELAQAMLDLGCKDALNLDGGGSSAIAVQGKLLNNPSDGKEREVTDVLALVPVK